MAGGGVRGGGALRAFARPPPPPARALPVPGPHHCPTDTPRRCPVNPKPKPNPRSCNEGEARAALAHVQRLLDAGLAPGDIGIITPYSAQASARGGSPPRKALGRAGPLSSTRQFPRRQPRRPARQPTSNTA